MAQITTYTCDKCGKNGTNITAAQTEDYIQLYTVEIRMGAPSMRVIAKQEWCRECMANIDLLSDNMRAWEKEQKIKSTSIPYTKTTFEEQLREIIREEIEDSESFSI